MRWLGVAGLVLMLGIAACSDSGDGEGSADDSPIIGDPERAVAEVNGAPVTLGEVNRVVRAYRTGQIFHADPTLPEGVLQRQAADELVGKRLLFEEAERAGFVIPDSEVQDFINGERRQFPTPEAFQEALTQLGLTERALADGYRIDMAVRQFIEAKIRSGLSVSVEEAREFYEENPESFTRPVHVHGRHILVRVPEDADETAEADARRKIDALAGRIHGGEDFAEVAMKESEDTGSGLRGGDLGFFRPGQMVQPFDSVSFALPTGVLSEPVRTRFGYHLIEIMEKQEPQIVPFEEVESRLINGLLSQKTQEEVEVLVASLRKGAKVRKHY